jgi:uncharacterized protein YcbK (DUF882 family)
LKWTIRHFKSKEFDSPDEPGSGVKMNSDFLKKLDQARLFAGFPWKVNAGFRTSSHNAKIKGAKFSKHLTGEAVDIACTNSEKRYKIVQAAMQAGINGIEVCDRHVHLDNREQETLWTDKSK